MRCSKADAEQSSKQNFYGSQGRLKDFQDGVAAYFQPSLRD
jgi:hypothetical protein